MFTLNKEKIQENKKIGSGRFSTVFPYQKEANDERWAVKVLEAKNNNQFKLQLENVVASSNQSHPNIVPVRGYYFEEQGTEGWKTYIKMPKMKNNLKELKDDYTSKKNVISKDQMIRYVYSIASALEYLEKKRVPHQNIKPSNILMDQNGKVYLADFGTTDFASEEEKAKLPKELGGIENYLAPELFTADKPLKRSALFKADVWSFGAVFAELAGSKPRPLTPSLSNDDKAKLIKEIIADMRKTYGQTVPDLISSALSIDPAQRKSFGEITAALEAKYSSELAKEKVQVEEVRKQTAAVDAYSLITTGTMLYKQAENIFGTTTKKGIIERFEEKKEVKAVKAAGALLASAAGSWWGSKKKEEPVEAKIADTSATTSTTSKFELNEVSMVKPNDPSKVDDKGVEELFNNAILPLKTKPLTQLAVNLRDCKQVTDQGVKQLGTLIGQNLGDLKFLSLNLTGCEGITDEGVKQLSAQVKQNLKNLQNLDLYFYGCGKVTEKGKEEVRKELTHIASLTI